MSSAIDTATVNSHSGRCILREVEQSDYRWINVARTIGLTRLMYSHRCLLYLTPPLTLHSSLHVTCGRQQGVAGALPAGIRTLGILYSAGLS